MEGLHLACGQNPRQKEPQWEMGSWDRLGSSEQCSRSLANVRDHARNDQRTHAMTLLKKQREQYAGLGPSSYAPIAQVLNRPSDDVTAQLRMKFYV